MNAQKVSNYIIQWMRDYLNATPLDGFIIGLSGGVDSALVAALAARTERKTLLLNLPIHQQNAEFQRAKNQIEALSQNFENVEGLTIDLTDSFELFKVAMPIVAQQHDLSMANTRARLRMTTLYAVGQAKNLLVTGTGNKIEDFGIGFYTKYGDGGVDINPIGDVLKSEVFQLANYLGVNKEILEAKPTDGLWGDDRNDEEQIGATYDELEEVMNFQGDVSQLSERQQEVLKIYNHLHRVNQHKFNPIPVCDLSKMREKK